MPELAYLNGEIMPIDQARVPVEDRGYQFGDAVYEFLASYNNRIFALERHLDRLENSMQALNFAPLSRNDVRTAILETFSQAHIPRAGIYIQISRGIAERNHAFPQSARAQVVITVRQVPQMTDTLRQQGARAITVTDIRWHRCDIKTVQLLPNVMAKQQALEAGADDAIFVSDDGIVREGTASNLFMVSKDTLFTHPLTPHILPGITRATLLDIYRNEQMTIYEDFFDTTALMDADEVFFTGTVTEVLPITRIDGQAIGNGLPGPVTHAMFDLLRDHAGA